MTATRDFTRQFTFEVHDCPSCGIPYAATPDFFARKNRESQSWYCPNGHTVWFTKSLLQQKQEELAKVERQRSYERDRRRAAEADAEHQRRRAAAAKGQLTKMRKRVANGVCPCCNRSFSNVVRHMRGKHPAEYDRMNGHAQPGRES